LIIYVVALNSTQRTENNNQIASPTLTIYKDFFEAQFLKETEQFYRLEATTSLADNSVSEYLKKVAQRLEEEVHRVQSYLHPSTLSVLIKKVEEVLIRDQLDVIYIEAEILLGNDKHQGKYRNNQPRMFNLFSIDLALLFKLIGRVPNATDKLKEIVENHIYQMGMKAIGCVREIALNVSLVYIFILILFLYRLESESLC
jgi:cullin 1